jgi:hypothetical protein
MAKEETLEKVGRDIERGDLGKARDRLHGLLTAYPDDLALRRRLGEVYARLQQPSMAGRYWYLEGERAPEMDAAVGAFEQEAGKDATVILSRLRFRGDAARLPTYARDKLAVLEEARRRKEQARAAALAPAQQDSQARRRREQGGWSEFPAEAPLTAGRTWTWRRSVGWQRTLFQARTRTVRGPGVAFGCLLVLALLVLALVLGFTAIVQWVVSVFS